MADYGNKIRVGIFGLWRGCSFLDILRDIPEAVPVALCDKDESMIAGARRHCENEDVEVFTDFDDFIRCDMDMVILCNYFHEHAIYAVKALEQGKNVLSETLPAATMKQAVDLVRAAEKSGLTYALAENYPHMKGCEALKRIYDGGTLGEVIYAEGEYVHPMSIPNYRHYTPTKYHWRRFLPRTYYSTHALAPLMYITGRDPVKVIGKVAHNPNYLLARGEESQDVCGDTAGIMLCEMDNGAVFRVTGTCNFGPHADWYRLGCFGGGVETVRGSEDEIKLSYNSWTLPENTEKDSVFEAEWPCLGELAEKAGHGGGDFWVLYNFIHNLIDGTKPYFDVYRAAAMASVAILGYRSACEGKEYTIPDFRDEEVRKLYDGDNINFFPDEDGGGANAHCTSHGWVAPFDDIVIK